MKLEAGFLHGWNKDQQKRHQLQTKVCIQITATRNLLVRETLPPRRSDEGLALASIQPGTGPVENGGSSPPGGDEDHEEPVKAACSPSGALMARVSYLETEASIQVHLLRFSPRVPLEEEVERGRVQPRVTLCL